MADFTSNLQSMKPYFPCMDNFLDPNMQFTNQLLPDQFQLNNLHNFMGGFSNQTFSSNQTQLQFQPNLGHNFPGMFNVSNQNPMPMNHPNVVPVQNQCSHENMKMKTMDLSESSCSGVSSPQVSEPGIMIKRKNSSSSSRRGKKVKNQEIEDDAPKDVVHVRARRGQATDSHSLAERVRRGKINERLKCLQDIVPGCYKTMGMAVMLDEIINYVQSLQNQVEFLSMRLTAASTFYDFNSDSDTIQSMQRAKAYEVAEIERLMKEANESLACLEPTTTWPL